MEATKEQTQSDMKDSLIFKCNACGKDTCSRCQGKHQYLNGFLCDSCYSSFHDRSTDRRLKIKKKKKLRNQYSPFSCIMPSARNLKIGLLALTSVSNTGNLLIDQDGMTFFCHNSSKIYYSILKIPIKEPRDLQKEKEFSLNFAEFTNALESFSGDTKLFLQRKQGNQKLLINPIGMSKFITINYDHDPEFLYPSKLYKINHTTSFLIEKEKLIEILTNCKIFNTRFTLKCTKELVTFSTMEGSTQYDYKFLPNEFEDYTCKEESKNEYELEILLSFLERFAEIIDTIKISSKIEYPLIIDINNAQALFFIAPRVPYDDEEDDY